MRYIKELMSFRPNHELEASFRRVERMLPKEGQEDG
jgi:hypothetical protein